MPRKRKPPKNEQDAWEEVLSQAGLSMEAGRTAHTSYVGTSAVLERLESVGYGVLKSEKIP